jgi:NitT/TauT family transport system permease protein
MRRRRETRPGSVAPRPAASRRATVLASQLALILLALAAWQFLPSVQALANHSNLFNRFFISSPSDIASRLRSLFASSGPNSIWPYLWKTVGASVVGLVIGVVLGVAVGLILGSSSFWSAVLRPFLVAFNAVPRIALIPIVVIVFGTTFRSQVVMSVLIVFFVVFFNAYEGALSPPQARLQNARLLGATPFQLTYRVRLPYVWVWTLAALPVAATFSVITVVTGEILTGYPGLGQLISTAESSADATLTFAVVVVLSVLGLVVVGICELIRRRALHWWADGRT